MGTWAIGMCCRCRSEHERVRECVPNPTPEARAAFEASERALLATPEWKAMSEAFRDEMRKRQSVPISPEAALRIEALEAILGELVAAFNPEPRVPALTLWDRASAVLHKSE